MTTGSRDRPSGSCGRGRKKVSTESPATVQSSPFTSTTPSTPVTSQVGPANQQLIMVSNPNYVLHFAMPPADPAIELRVGDSSSTPQQDAPLTSPVIQLRIFSDGMQVFAPNNNACTQEISEVIKSMYDHPWPTYTQILVETRDRWFQKWTVEPNNLKVIWDAEHNLMIRKIYDHRAAKRLQ
ncbi:hypothetical protein Ahy_B02g058572 isoform B [Arachis hypogaea]|uniref:Uncharacterized protein n=1 Tax=Arachis hypogaea TaxID=3818 RepID=A0A445AEW5_ARAHY|nr:hypothetical protein Ahy_B02g058572 isoform B [Arachis hypogaea]